MTTFQTKCPHCQHIFAITEHQLGLKNGLARCGSCKQVFSAKDNLQASPAPVTPKRTASPASIVKPLPQFPDLPLSTAPASSPIIDARDTVQIIPAIQPKSHHKEEDELLFDDKSGLDDEPEQPSQSSNSDFSFDILDDFDKLAAPTTKTTPNTTSNDKSSASNAPAFQQDDTVSLKNNDDESWLEELLEKEAVAEKNQSYLASSKIDSQSNATDVSSLLEAFGVEVAEEKALAQPEYQQRLEQRFNHQPTAQQLAQRPPLTRHLLWGLGSLFLLLGLAAQYMVFNRDNLVKHPDSAQTVRGICDGLHLPCNLPYADLKSIEAKTLSFEGKDNTSDVIISLTNRSSQNQVYPNLKITLQSNNVGVAQLIATPEQYLDDASRTFMPQQVKAIKLRINFPRNKADQVVVDPFY